MWVLNAKPAPTPTWQVQDSRGHRVGRCKEWAKVVGDDQVDGPVLAMRRKGQLSVPTVQQATKPERVMTYRSVTCGSMTDLVTCFFFCTIVSLQTT